jgi:fructose-1,6-bisphosphatase
MADQIHHGSKEDLLAGIALSVSNMNNRENNVWDGTLTPQDIINLSRMIYNPKAKKSIYESLTVDDASKIHHISKLQILKMQDSSSQKETFRNLRKLLPGFLDSEGKTEIQI